MPKDMPFSQSLLITSLAPLGAVFGVLATAFIVLLFSLMIAIVVFAVGCVLAIVAAVVSIFRGVGTFNQLEEFIDVAFEYLSILNIPIILVSAIFFGAGLFGGAARFLEIFAKSNTGPNAARTFFAYQLIVFLTLVWLSGHISLLQLDGDTFPVLVSLSTFVLLTLIYSARFSRVYRGEASIGEILSQYL